MGLLADDFSSMDADHDISLVELHNEKLIDIKRTLATIHDESWPQT